MAARAIQNRRFNAVGLLASTNPRVSVYRSFMAGLTQGCREHDLHLSVGEVIDEKLSDEQFVPKILREWSVDGLLIAYMYNFPPHLADLIEQYRIPSIWLNAKREHDCVHPDDFNAIHQATEHLLELGHQRISYVHTYIGEHYSATDRRAGYTHAMEAAGLSPRPLYDRLEANVHLTRLHDDIRALAQREDRPTAFVCYGSDQAMTIYHAATLAGLSIPRDLSIVGLGPESISQMGRDIATLIVDSQRIGQTAIDLLARKIRRPSELFDPVAVPMRQRHFDKSIAPPIRP
jgi:DNA-binding LacI/PurR family transcriptional regulator